MTDDIQKVREAYKAALQEVRGVEPHVLPGFIEALAKRLQPRTEPVKKVWCVKLKTADRFLKTYGTIAERLDSVSADIISDRPDLVAAEWERRVRERARRLGVRVVESMTAFDRYDLFPELDQRHP